MEITLIVNRYSHGQQNHLPKLIKPFFSVGRRLESSVRTAYAYHHGTFDYNRMPIAPMGCSVQYHIKPNRRKTFGEHSGNGFYLKMSAEHYRTHVVFCKKTRAKRVADTFFSSRSISHNPGSRQRTPLSMHLRNCGTPFRGFNTQKTMPTLKLFDAWNKRFSLKTNRSSRWGNRSNFQGWNIKSNLPSKFQGCASMIPHPRSCVTAEALR